MRALGLAIAALLITPPPAAADNTYQVSAPPTTDAAGTCSPVVSGLSTCTTLRAAVTAASGSAGHDVISIGAGTYPLTLGALTLSQDTSIAGAGARLTTIQVSGGSQGFIISSGVTADLSLMTIQGGNANSGSGGNISNSGTLTLTYMRLTGGSALNGGGLANIGASGATATIAFSLIDHNS